MSEDTFSTWGVVDIPGHNRIAGKLTEQTIAGATFLRVDVPELQVRSRKLSFDGKIIVDTRAAFTKFIGASSIYALTPTDEATARLAAAALHIEPIERWQLDQAQKALMPVGDGLNFGEDPDSSGNVDDPDADL